MSHAGFDYGDKEDLQFLKIQLTQKHKNRDKQIVDGKIPVVERELRRIDKEFKNLNQKKINEGKAPPERMPAEMQERKLVAEARYDIAKAELEEIEKHLKAIEKQELKQHEKTVLRYGPKGTSKLSDGVIAEVDGQKVEIKSGVPVISDQASPYNGMTSADYFDYIVKPWNRLQKELPDKQKLKRKLKDGQSLEEQYNKIVSEKLEKHGKHLLEIEWRKNMKIPSWPKNVKK
jgi:hypothetical protein